MKTRSFVLGTAAIVFAVGSAFATKNSSVFATAYVLADLGQGAGTQCYQTTTNCTPSGNINCKVSISVGGVPTDTNGRTQGSCAIQKVNTDSPFSATIVGAPVTGPVFVEPYE